MKKLYWVILFFVSVIQSSQPSGKWYFFKSARDMLYTPGTEEHVEFPENVRQEVIQAARAKKKWETTKDKDAYTSFIVHKATATQNLAVHLERRLGRSDEISTSQVIESGNFLHNTLSPCFVSKEADEISLSTLSSGLTTHSASLPSNLSDAARCEMSLSDVSQGGLGKQKAISQSQLLSSTKKLKAAVKIKQAGHAVSVDEKETQAFTAAISFQKVLQELKSSVKEVAPVQVPEFKRVEDECILLRGDHLKTQSKRRVHQGKKSKQEDNAYLNKVYQQAVVAQIQQENVMRHQVATSFVTEILSSAVQKEVKRAQIKAQVEVARQAMQRHEESKKLEEARKHSLDDSLSRVALLLAKRMEKQTVLQPSDYTTIQQGIRDNLSSECLEEIIKYVEDSALNTAQLSWDEMLKSGNETLQQLLTQDKVFPADYVWKGCVDYPNNQKNLAKALLSTEWYKTARPSALEFSYIQGVYKYLIFARLYEQYREQFESKKNS